MYLRAKVKFNRLNQLCAPAFYDLADDVAVGVCQHKIRIFFRHYDDHAHAHIKRSHHLGGLHFLRDDFKDLRRADRRALDLRTQPLWKYARQIFHDTAARDVRERVDLVF